MAVCFCVCVCVFSGFCASMACSCLFTCFVHLIVSILLGCFPIVFQLATLETGFDQLNHSNFLRSLLDLDSSGM